MDLYIQTTEEAELLDALLAETEQIADKPTFGSDSESLERQAEHLRLELREAMNAGSVDDCVRIKTQLEILPIQIRKARVEEAKAAIAQASVQIAETKSLIEEARTLRSERQRIFGEKMRAAEEAGTAAQKADFVMWRLETELDNHRAVVRHQERLIDELLGGQNDD